jgi:hypothetical protein
MAPGSIRADGAGAAGVALLDGAVRMAGGEPRSGESGAVDKMGDTGALSPAPILADQDRIHSSGGNGV